MIWLIFCFPDPGGLNYSDLTESGSTSLVFLLSNIIHTTAHIILLAFFNRLDNENLPLTLHSSLNHLLAYTRKGLEYISQVSSQIFAKIDFGNFVSKSCFFSRNFRGVYFSLCPKNVSYWLVGEKIWWFVKKKREYTWEEDQKGGGEKYHILGQNLPLQTFFLDFLRFSQSYLEIINQKNFIKGIYLKSVFSHDPGCHQGVWGWGVGIWKEGFPYLLVRMLTPTYSCPVLN